MIRMTVRRLTALLALGLATAAAPALAQQKPAPRAQHAHVHGKLELDIAIEGTAVTIEMEAPLDSLLGFERAPRTDAEREAVASMTKRLRAADQLFVIDPAAGCKLGPVQLDSPVLSGDKPAETKPAAGAKVGDAKAAAKPAAKPAEDGDHADLDASFAFNCVDASRARYVEVQLFDAFKNLRQIESEIVAPQGQFKRVLRRPATRLTWDK